jgi:quinol monooxygenase YgiN
VSSRRLYIYFRVERDSVADVVAAVRELHAAWPATMPGLRCELMRRDDDGGDVTLMETYACAEGVSAAWQERIEREAMNRLRPWLVGERHIEVFVPCSPRPGAD